MVMLHTGLLVGALAEVWLLGRPFIAVARLADARDRRCSARSGGSGSSAPSASSGTRAIIVVPGMPLSRRGPVPLGAAAASQLPARGGRGPRDPARAHGVDHRRSSSPC